ncbi:ABC transporter ATP-binding protein [Virgibacillus halodenitrificans]|uniref:Multidrug ABC transporter ATP-binding protein n=1 Tax=Virgibacillus halodenitrificans TaxID=1482 RepID=A0AAC9J3M8_VIRHA|nr:ABC transporter ATP-binding protein [Virgibacillus halodenitrificans]APC50104.1 multidrug ABC transporter ATP-binding protein [Virgibacillus halodenitrificans]MCG1027587.1 ABC transporter ATP-binding protein [Virgibacillus halodenitrificans]
MIRRFFSYYKPHKRLFIIDFTAAVIVAILELAFPVAVQSFIDKLLPEKNWDVIITVSILLLLVYLLSSFLQYIVTYLGHKLGLNIETDMRQDLFKHVQSQSFRFFDNTKTGHIMSRITNDLFDIGELAHHGPEDFFISIMTFIGAFIIMFTINMKLAFIILIAVPILIFLIAFSNIKMNKAWRTMYENIASVNARVEDAVSGVRVVQSFTNEAFEMERFTKDNYKFRRAKAGAYKVMAIVHSNIYMLMRLITLLVLVVGAWFTYTGQLSTGELVSFVLFVNVLFNPIQKITALLELYPKGMAGFKRFTELLDTEAEVQDQPNAKQISHLNGDISFNKVTFGYEKTQEPVLNALSFSIQAGETIAFVGPSGAGKTTICSLIPRFYDVESGSITIDGIDLRDMTKESLRKQIGIVQQDVFLFTGTLKENIAYGNRDATDEEIKHAARQAHMEEFINELPDGYETQVGERGLKLSGGQKQRIAIARMFLKNPPILILDEATSALDTETETIIQKALTELAKERTTLIIAHRLATIKNADRIMVVTKSGIEEEGSHEELLQRDGIFAHLHKVQMK